MFSTFGTERRGKDEFSERCLSLPYAQKHVILGSLCTYETTGQAVHHQLILSLCKPQA